MCFTLFVGTERPLARKPWDQEAPDLCVESLAPYEGCMRRVFTKPEVQYVGSTSGCGCDFPHTGLQENGKWYVVQQGGNEEAWEKTCRDNRAKLVTLLRETNEEDIEVYGVFDGKHDKEPKTMESILLRSILDDGFFFKEQVFYRVNTGNR